MFGFGFLCAQSPVENTQEVVETNARAKVTPRKALSSEPVHGVRTTKDEPVPPQEALQALKDGNQRYVDGGSYSGTEQAWRSALANHGQRPMAAIVGCADSRCPTDMLFDTKPGDLFVLRNAGNTCTHAEGSFVGSLEYAVQHLATNLIVVLGHTKCGAVVGATKTMLAQQEKAKAGEKCDSVLEVLLTDLMPVAEQAQAEKPGLTVDELAEHAIMVNVFNTVERVIEYSDVIRKKVRAGEIEVHGAIYDLATGKVNFLGPSRRQALLMGSQGTLVGRLNTASEGDKAQTLSVGRLSEQMRSWKRGVEQEGSDASTTTPTK